MKELTDAQNEYFKDSKIRSKNGELKVLYHGSKNKDFDTFGEINTPPGYWFSEDKDYALSHASNENNLIEVYLNAENPFYFDGIDGSEESFEEWQDKLTDLYNECFGSRIWDEKNIFSIDFRDFLMDKGYDAMIWAHDDADTIVVFKPNQIKSIDNLYPTKNDNFKDNSKEYFELHSPSLDEKLQAADKKVDRSKSNNTKDLER